MTIPIKWEVTPGFAIGPVELGMLESDIVRVAGIPLRTSERSGVRTLYFEAVTVVLVRDSVSTIVAEPPSGAEVIGSSSIRVGMPFEELQPHVRSALEYDDEEGLWRSGAQEGLLLELARHADPGEEALDPPFVPEQYDMTRPEMAVVRRIFVQ